MELGPVMEWMVTGYVLLLFVDTPTTTLAYEYEYEL